MFDYRLMSVDALPFLWPVFACALISWLIGTIPFGLVLTRVAGQGDIRKLGSGNIGATNVLRTGMHGLALATLVLDIGKGFLTVTAAREFGGPDFAVVAAVAVVLGHVFSVWLRFRGGKGVATMLGAAVALSLSAGAVACMAWLVAFAFTRISSVGGIVSALALPVSMWVFTRDLPFAVACILIATLVIIRHWSNIIRLFNGTEPRTEIRISRR